MDVLKTNACTSLLNILHSILFVPLIKYLQNCILSSSFLSHNKFINQNKLKIK